MLKLTYWLGSIITLLILTPIVLSLVSRFQEPQLGSGHDRLAPCPSRPNCVCSEYPASSSFSLPITFVGAPDEAWQRAKGSIIAMGGEIIQDDEHSLHAIFTSRFLRFIDDLELRQDMAEGVIHLRSAARAGYSDMGVNRKRTEALRSLYTKP